MSDVSNMHPSNASVDSADFTNYASDGERPNLTDGASLNEDDAADSSETKRCGTLGLLFDATGRSRVFAIQEGPQEGGINVNVVASATDTRITEAPTDADDTRTDEPQTMESSVSASSSSSVGFDAEMLNSKQSATLDNHAHSVIESETSVAGARKPLEKIASAVSARVLEGYQRTQDTCEAIRVARNTAGIGAGLKKSCIAVAQAGFTGYALYQDGKTKTIDTLTEGAGVVAALAAEQMISPEAQEKLGSAAQYIQDSVGPVVQGSVQIGSEVYDGARNAFSAASDSLSEIVSMAYAEIAPERREAIENRVQRRRDGQEYVKALALEIGKPIFMQALVYMQRGVTNLLTHDPDMWSWVRVNIERVIELFWKDVEVEVLHLLEGLVLQNNDDVEKDTPRASSWLLCCCCYYKLRAFVLYHSLPCDKSWFGQLKDPVYLIITVFSSFPFFSCRVVFYTVQLALVAAAPDGVDEYQLVCFILNLKGLQFLTSGVLLSVYGSAQQFYALHLCDFSKACMLQHYPGQGEPMGFAVLDYVGSCILVWIAFKLLPRSLPHGSRAKRTEFWRNSSLAQLREASREQLVPNPGGRICVLLKWDLACFLLCMFCTVLLIWWRLVKSTMDSRELLAYLFWCRVAYSMLSLPFLFFTMPFLGRFLTHVEPTGFSRNGRCVPFRFSSQSSMTQPLLGGFDRTMVVRPLLRRAEKLV